MISCFKGKFKVTSPRAYRVLFGKREFHGGLDLVALEDTNVYAIADGVIDATPYEKNGFGYYIRQKLPDGRKIYYGHLEKGSICVKPGDKVKQGDKLGVMGSTGNSTGEHTHIELRPKGTSKESLDICKFTGIPNKVGAYEADGFEISPYEAACVVEDKTGLSKDTIKWLWTYKYANELMVKLYRAMR